MTAGTAGSLLRLGAFRRVFTAQAISVGGSALSPVALTLGVLDATRSRADLSFVLAANTLPMVVCLLFGHVVTSRVPLLRLAITGNAVAAVGQAALGTLFLVGPYSTWATASLQCVSGAAVAVYLPTTLGITARTVPAEMLQRANAALSMTRSLALSIGPVIAGVIVAVAGPGWALLADGLSFAVSAVVLARVRLNQPPATAAADHQADDQAPLGRLLHGVREVAYRPWVWSSIGFFAVAQFSTAVFLVLGPALLALHPGGNTRWALVVSATGIGQLVGDLLSMRLRPRLPLLTARLTGVLAAPVLLALAWGSPLALVTTCAAAAGVAVTFSDTLWFTALQQQLPASSLQAVSAYDWAVSLALRPAGYLGAAVFAGWLGVTTTLILTAFLLTAAGLAGLALRDVRTITASSAGARIT
jgi:predicted MFS family arabinose efflux permease